MNSSGIVTADVKSAFDRDGYLVFEDFASPEACAGLMNQAASLLQNFDVDEHRSIFSTTDQKHRTDDYFLSSGDKVRFFLEEEAIDEAGNLRQPVEQSINKIGHAMHDLDPVFGAFSRDPRLEEIVTELGMGDPRLLQSMYIYKQPRIGGVVTCHTDSTFIYTEPLSCIGLWFAMEDATLENGCLHVLPGGHKAPLKSRFRRDGAGGVTTDVMDESPWPEPVAGPPYVALEAKAGTLVVLHGLVPHWSAPNRSPRSRQAYTLHLVDGSAAYPADNWLQRAPDFPVRGFN
ncbi:MAG: phytanoyl-CoA dioxygenase family protein [Pseudomonadota bacterium]